MEGEKAVQSTEHHERENQAKGSRTVSVEHVGSAAVFPASDAPAPAGPPIQAEDGST